MFKLVTGIVLGFSAGTFAGLRANKLIQTLRIHKDLVSQFNCNQKESSKELSDAETQT